MAIESRRWIALGTGFHPFSDDDHRYHHHHQQQQQRQDDDNQIQKPRREGRS